MQLLFRRTAPFITAFAITIGIIAPLRVTAQNDPNFNTSGGEGTGVARISLIEGSVAVQRGDSSDSIAAAPNAPVLGGDYLTSGDTSRAEVQLDGYSQIRLGQDVQMRFTRLDASNRSIQVAAGTLDLRLMHGPDGSNTIDTPSITVKPVQSGSYRVTVTPDGQTLITVRSGRARVVTPQGEQDLQPGTTLVAQGTAANPSIQTEDAVALDDFDRFNADRDRAYAPALADAAYVNPDIGGVEDLNADGRWVTDGSYGHVWVPSSVGPDWAPYRDGRWVWEEGYGWTWIADERWGWAPYHYGSWYHSPNYGWCWYPPQPRVYVPWRPALVAFIGFGAGSEFSLSFGDGDRFNNIGWVPLAPFEPYHPWWQNRYGYRGPAVVNNVTNITNVTNVTNITNVNVYKNVRYNAVSSVSSQRFLQGNFTRNVAVSGLQLRQARVFRGAIPVVPTASNLRFTKSAVAPRVAVRTALVERSFAGNAIVVRRTPFTTQRLSFATATHAAITPLHFKDARTTPLIVGRAVVPPAPHNGNVPLVPARVQTQRLPIVQNRPIEHPVPQSQRLNAVPGHPPATAPAGNAWTRFNQTRTPQNPPLRVDTKVDHSVTGAAPVKTPERLQTGTRIDRAPAPGQQTRTLPSANVYHAPVYPQTSRPPLPATPDYARLPATPYRAPVPANPYRSPAPAPPYPAPAGIEHPAHAAGRISPESHRPSESHVPSTAVHAAHPEAPIVHHADPAPHPVPPRPAPATKPEPPHENHEPPHRQMLR